MTSQKPLSLSFALADSTEISQIDRQQMLRWRKILPKSDVVCWSYANVQ